MAEFYDLPRFYQMSLLKQLTEYPTLLEAKQSYSLRPRLSYSRFDPQRTLSDLQVSPYLFQYDPDESLHVNRIKNTVMKLITMEPLASDLHLYDYWGFVLQDGYTPIVICQNLQPRFPDRIATIQIRPLWDAPIRVELVMHPRVKMLWSGAVFAAVAAALSFLKN